MSDIRRVYAFKNTKKICDMSSSEGTYIAICDAWTKKLVVGGLVYGAVFDETFE